MPSEFEPTIYHPIQDGFGNPFARDYTLEGCGRCGAAVPAVKEMREQHENWHRQLEKNTYATIRLQQKVRGIAAWLDEFKKLNS